MRVRFIVVLFLSMLLILSSSIIITYRAIGKTQESVKGNLLNNLLSRYKDNPEMKKSIEIYLAFSQKRAVEITRDSLTYYSIVLFIMGILFVFSIFAITRPIKRLSNKVNLILHDNKTMNEILRGRFKPKGSYEVKQLYIAFDKLVRDIKEYEEIVGDRERYRGWKEIARIIVHEINNLISPIETYSGYLLETLPQSVSHVTPKVRAILSKIEEIRETLGKFRDLAHLPEPRIREVNLYKLTHDIVEEFKGVEFAPAFASSKESFPYVEENDFIVNTDPLLFGEILRNIVKNAVESTFPSTTSNSFEGSSGEREKESPRVTVTIQKKENTVRLEVTDNGPGIPENIRDKIFTPGFSTKAGNIGIGLSLVKSLSEQLGIEIKLESNRGEGTKFLIDLQTSISQKQKKQREI